ncbi:MAG: hypothetical protein LAP40_14840 [Acidobacteriia bacterium]|nr:hypothetical protein [Terriglobia bacterium]
MRATNAAIAACLFAAASSAQVLAPEEIRDPQLRGLQEKYLSDLKLITRAVAAHEFPYHFYFSRKLDLDEKEQKRSDQRSVQFDRYEGQVVLKITGNYFASYSAELMKPEERARLTYQAVMLPLLRAAVPAMEKADGPQAFAFEISHHVRKKVLGVSNEAVENLVLILPKASAQRLVASSDPQAQQAAVSEGEVFLNAAPISLWPRPDEEAAARPAAPAGAAPAPSFPTPAAKVRVETPAPPAAARDTSPEAVKGLQKAYQTSLDRMVQEMEPQAHFVRYAPPAFIPFHNGLYLQLSLTTTLPPAAAGSQYRLAALAFDQHIAHLIRPALAYFKDRDDFDGIDFSATVRLAADSADAGALAVEFFFPLKLLRAYADFDTTGQQLIDPSFVLINGERVSLNLQVAEAGAPSK